MGSRLLLGAAMVLAAFAFPVASQAADASGAHAKKHHGAQHHRYNHVGGHRYSYQNESFPYNPQNNAPGHYNNQTFWERVETQRNYPVGY